MSRSVRRWQAAVATLAALLVGVSVPLANSQWMVTQHVLRSGPTPAAQQIAAVEPPRESIRPVVPNAQFDAWQVAISSSDAVASNLKQLERIEPETRPLAVAALTRAALQQQ